MTENSDDTMKLEVIPVEMIVNTPIINSKIAEMVQCLKCTYRPAFRRGIHLAGELSSREPRLTRSQSRTLSRLGFQTLSSIHKRLETSEDGCDNSSDSDQHVDKEEDTSRRSMVMLPTNSLPYLLFDQPLPAQRYHKSVSVEPADMDWTGFLQNNEEYSDEYDQDFRYQDHLNSESDDYMETLLLPVAVTELHGLWASSQSLMLPNEQSLAQQHKRSPSSPQSSSSSESEQLGLVGDIKSDPDDPSAVYPLETSDHRISNHLNTSADVNSAEKCVVSACSPTPVHSSCSSPCVERARGKRKCLQQSYSVKKIRLSPSAQSTKRPAFDDPEEASNDSILEAGRITVPALEGSCGSGGSGNGESAPSATVRVAPISDSNRRGSSHQRRYKTPTNKQSMPAGNALFARRRRVGSLLIEPVKIDERISKCLKLGGFGEERVSNKQQLSDSNTVVSPVSVSSSRGSVAINTPVSPCYPAKATLAPSTPPISPAKLSSPSCDQTVSPERTLSSSSSGLPSSSDTLSSSSSGVFSSQTVLSSSSGLSSSQPAPLSSQPAPLSSQPRLPSSSGLSLSQSNLSSSPATLSLSAAPSSSSTTLPSSSVFFSSQTIIPVSSGLSPSVTLSSSSATSSASSTLSSSSATLSSSALPSSSATMLTSLVKDLTALVPAPTIVQAFPVVNQNEDTDEADWTLLQPYEMPRTPTRSVSPGPVLGFPSPVVLTPSVSASGPSVSPQNSMLVTPTASRSPGRDQDSGDEDCVIRPAEPSLGGIFDLLLQTGGMGRSEVLSNTGAVSSIPVSTCTGRQSEGVATVSCSGLTPGAESSTADTTNSQTGGALSARIRARRPRLQQRRAELFRSVILADRTSRQLHEKQVASCFLQRVRAVASPSIFARIRDRLASFPTDGSGDQLALFDQLLHLLSPHQLLSSELPLFFSEQVAVQRSCVLQRARAHQLVRLARQLQLAAASRPHQAVKIQRAISTLSGRVLSSSSSPASEQLDIRAEMLRLHGVLQPVLRSFPQLLQELQQLVASEPPPAHLYEQSDQFQFVSVEELAEQPDTTSSVNECTVSDGEWDDICLIGDVQPDLYGTDQCPCACHEDSEAGPRLKGRSHHCLLCGLKFIDGRVFIQTGKVLRLASVVYCEDSHSSQPKVPPGKTGRSAPRRRAWSRREDFVLMDSVRRLGDEEATFTSLRSKLGGRSIKLIRDRFNLLMEKLRRMQDASSQEVPSEHKEDVSEAEQLTASVNKTVNSELKNVDKDVAGFEQGSVNADELNDTVKCVSDDKNSAHKAPVNMSDQEKSS